MLLNIQNILLFYLHHILVDENLDEDGYIEFTEQGLLSLTYWYKPWSHAPYTCHWCCRSSGTKGKQMCLALGGKETGSSRGYTVYSLD